MPRLTDAQRAVQSALAQLWTIQDLAEETAYFDTAGNDALGTWRRNAPDCKRWVAVVAAGGRVSELPPDLKTNRAYFNGQGWGIPEC